jgi:hypothetical protein
MTDSARHGAALVASTSGTTANLGQATAQRPSDSLTLDELLAEPMVEQLMQRDRTDEATIRGLWQRIGAGRPASYRVACRRNREPRVRTRSPGCCTKPPGFPG